MGKSCFHSSIEGAQHGGKGLAGFLAFAKAIGATGAQPSNYMVTKPDGTLMTAKEILDACEQAGVVLDGISAHCPFWVHTTAWTRSKTIRPFIPADVAKKSVEEIEQWAEDTILYLLDLVDELKRPIVPMFWGVVHGWEAATGYPWGFFKGSDYDLIAEGDERFLTKTEEIRRRANSGAIILAHEIHPGTAAMCAADFKHLVEVADGDLCLGVNVDPSHCWEGEGWYDRFTAVGDRCYGCHVKNHTIRPGFPLRSMEPNWRKRAVEFTDLGTGDIKLKRFVELVMRIGYPQRYCQKSGTETAPLVTEAESGHQDLDETAKDGVQYINEELLLVPAAGSFEKGMGEAA